MDATCHDGYCGKCHGAKLIVFGLVLIVNQLYLKLDIWLVLGILVVLKGIMKLSMPSCSHCQPDKKGRK